MPQLNNVVLKDNANTDKTFVPKGISGGVAKLGLGTGVPAGDQLITVQRTRTTTGREKASVKLILPVVQDVTYNGITKPTVIRTTYVDMVFTFDPTSNTTERADAVAYAKNFLANAFGVSVIKDLEDVY